MEDEHERAPRQVDRLSLAMAVRLTAIVARAAEARQLTFDQRLQPMRHVIDEVERFHGPDAQPGGDPTDCADPVAHYGAGHLREYDIRLSHAAILEKSDCDCNLLEALTDLKHARDVCRDTDDGESTMSIPTWVGVGGEQFSAALDTALRSRSE